MIIMKFYTKRYGAFFSSSVKPLLKSRFSVRVNSNSFQSQFLTIGLI